MPTEPPPAAASSAQVLIVSGLSGSGKSVALRTLEDLDYYCADNLPAELLPQFVDSVVDGDRDATRLAVGIDVRNRVEDLADLPRSLAALGQAGHVRRTPLLRSVAVTVDNSSEVPGAVIDGPEPASFRSDGGWGCWVRRVGGAI